jgi:BMFP domain-containing protein YqiC
MREWRLERVGTPKLDKSAGMHRFKWQLRHAGAWDEDADRSGRNGPMVTPGTYQARLTVGDWTGNESFEALIDPRVVKEGFVSREDIAAQVEIALDARDALSSARLASARLERALEGATGRKRETLEEIKEELVTPQRRYSQPMLIDQLSYLYSNLDRADQRPGVDARERYQSLQNQLDELVAKLTAVIGNTDDAN